MLRFIPWMAAWLQVLPHGECAVAPGVYVVRAESTGKTSVSKVAVR